MSNENPRRQPLWTGASLFTVSATSLLLMIAAIVPAEESAANASHNWFTASLVITLVAVALAASIVGWSLNSSGRPAIGVRIYFVAEVLLLAAAGVALAQRSAWHDAAPDMPVVFFVPFVLIGLAACGAPSRSFRAADDPPHTGRAPGCRHLNHRRLSPALERAASHDSCLPTPHHARGRRPSPHRCRRGGRSQGDRALRSPERLADAFADESYQARVRTPLPGRHLLAVSFGLAVLMYEARIQAHSYGAVASLNQMPRRRSLVDSIESLSPHRARELVVDPCTSAVSRRSGDRTAPVCFAFVRMAAALLAVAAARRRPSLALKADAAIADRRPSPGFSLALVLWKRLSEGSLANRGFLSVDTAAFDLGGHRGGRCLCSQPRSVCGRVGVPGARPGLALYAAGALRSYRSSARSRVCLEGSATS